MSINYSSTTVYVSNDDIDAYQRVNCIMIKTREEMYGVIGVYSAMCLISTVIGFYAVIVHYWSSKNAHDIIFEIRLWSILGTIFFVLFDYDSVVDVYFAMKCDLSPNSYLAKYDYYGSILNAMGLYTIYFLFVLKLKHSFKDSLFNVSHVKIISLTIFGIIGFTCYIIGFIILIVTSPDSEQVVTDVAALGAILSGIGLIFYIFGNILLCKTLISTLYAFIKYENEDNTTLNKDDEMFQSFVRLIVVYTCAISSTVIIVAIWVFSFFVFNAYENVILLNQWAMWFRALLILDNIVNICCLLFQNVSALTFYKHTCCLCHSCVMKIAQRRINHHLNITHMARIETETETSQQVKI